MSISSQAQSELGKRANEEKYDSTKLSKAMEFIRALVQKEDSDSSSSTSSGTAAESNDSAESSLRHVVGKASSNSCRE